MELRSIGNASFVITTDEGKKLYLDPWIETNTSCQLKLEDINDADYVFVTHGHPGHFGRGDSVKIAKQCNVPFCTNPTLAAYLIENGVLTADQIIVLELNKTTTVGNFTVTPFVTTHPPEPAGHKKTPEPPEPNCGYVFEIDGVRFLHVGDTIADKVFEGIKDIDVAMMPLWSKAMADPKDVVVPRIAETLAMFNPKLVVTHYRYESDIFAPEELGELLAKNKTPTAVFKTIPGDSFKINGNTYAYKCGGWQFP